MFKGIVSGLKRNFRKIRSCLNCRIVFLMGTAQRPHRGHPGSQFNSEKDPCKRDFMPFGFSHFFTCTAHLPPTPSLPMPDLTPPVLKLPAQAKNPPRCAVPQQVGCRSPRIARPRAKREGLTAPFVCSNP